MSVNAVNQTDGSLLRVAGGTLYADSPIGTISPFGGSAIPSGYLLCNGQAVSRTSYKELFTTIGVAFGSGDGSTTFNVPDLRETVPVGSGTRGSGIADHDTYDVGQFKDDQLQDHAHYGVWSRRKGTYFEGVSSSEYEMQDNPLVSHEGVYGARTGSTTHGKQLGVNYIIKAKQVAVPADFVDAIDEVVDESKPIEVTATLDFNAYGNALITPPNGYKIISAIMPDHNWAFDVFYDNNLPYVHSRGLTDYSVKITGSATIILVYIKA